MSFAYYQSTVSSHDKEISKLLIKIWISHLRFMRCLRCQDFVLFEYVVTFIAMYHEMRDSITFNLLTIFFFVLHTCDHLFIILIPLIFWNCSTNTWRSDHFFSLPLQINSLWRLVSDCSSSMQVFVANHHISPWKIKITSYMIKIYILLSD